MGRPTYYESTFGADVPVQIEHRMQPMSRHVSCPIQNLKKQLEPLETTLRIQHVHPSVPHCLESGRTSEAPTSRWRSPWCLEIQTSLTCSNSAEESPLEVKKALKMQLHASKCKPLAGSMDKSGLLTMIHHAADLGHTIKTCTTRDSVVFSGQIAWLQRVAVARLLYMSTT